MSSSSLSSKTCSREERMCLCWNSILTSHFFTQLIIIFCAELRSEVWFTGKRWNQRKQLRSKMMTTVCGKTGRRGIFFRQKLEVWELVGATHGPLTTSQDAAENVATGFLSDIQVEEDEVMRNLGLGSCFSLAEILHQMLLIRYCPVITGKLIPRMVVCTAEPYRTESQPEQAVSVDLGVQSNDAGWFYFLPCFALV